MAECECSACRQCRPQNCWCHRANVELRSAAASGRRSFAVHLVAPVSGDDWRAVRGELQLWLKRLRKARQGFRFLAVPFEEDGGRGFDALVHETAFRAVSASALRRAWHGVSSCGTVFAVPAFVSRPVLPVRVAASLAYGYASFEAAREGRRSLTRRRGRSTRAMRRVRNALLAQRRCRQLAIPEHESELKRATAQRGRAASE